MKNRNLVISPKTKVSQLIETYPQLEDVLISQVPVFKKLKNPVLRKTVAKIATLQQAASIGNIEVGDLINILRNEVGQDLISIDFDNPYTTVKPEWFDEKIIAQEFDVREMLAAGEHPVNQVISDLNQMKNKAIYKLVSSFITAPLIDKASSLQITHWVVKENDKLYTIYFYKA